MREANGLVTPSDKAQALPAGGGALIAARARAAAPRRENAVAADAEAALRFLCNAV
jgi:hypothetical protein